MANKERVRSVLNRIERDPSSFDMSDWVATDDVCGTTFCAAGHAAMDAGAEVVTKQFDWDHDGSYRYTWFEFPGDESDHYGDIAEWAKEYLGLTNEEYRDPNYGETGLFYDTNENALARLRELAELDE